MGNSCCRGGASSMVFPHVLRSTERDSLLGDNISSLGVSSRFDYNKQQHQHEHAHREVKIKITKEKLEELLGKADVHGMSVDQVVSVLISVSADHHYYTNHDDDDDSLQFHHRSWKPALQTIPEVNQLDHID